jgi:hypothetical protein
MSHGYIILQDLPLMLFQAICQLGHLKMVDFKIVFVSHFGYSRPPTHTHTRARAHTHKHPRPNIYADIIFPHNWLLTYIDIITTDITVMITNILKLYTIIVTINRLELRLYLYLNWVLFFMKLNLFIEIYTNFNIQ